MISGERSKIAIMKNSMARLIIPFSKNFRPFAKKSDTAPAGKRNRDVYFERIESTAKTGQRYRVRDCPSSHGNTKYMLKSIKRISTPSRYPALPAHTAYDDIPNKAAATNAVAVSAYFLRSKYIKPIQKKPKSRNGKRVASVLSPNKAKLACCMANTNGGAS